MKYLIKRKGKMYFRIHIPNHLQSIFGRTEIFRCLGDYDEQQGKYITQLLGKKVRWTFSIITTNGLGGMSENSLQEIVEKLICDDIPSVRKKRIKSIKETYKLSHLIDTFKKVKSNKWGYRTKLHYSFMLGLFLRIVGNKSIDTITREDCKKYKDIIVQLPPHMSKKYKGKSIQYIISKGDKRLNKKTVNSYLVLISSFFQWCIDEEYIFHNPCNKLLLPVNRRSSKERDKFPISILQNIIKGLISLKDISKYWVPLIGLYSGCRMNEILQLYVSDIKKIDGIWCFDINSNGEDKRLKNVHSERLVPIHPKLIELGLLDYWKRTKEEHKNRLFYNTKLSRDGSYSLEFSKWFGRFKKKLNITSSKLTFHSFRHNFIDNLKQNDVRDTYIKELVGHTDKSITMERYGKRYNVGKLYKVISKIDYKVVFYP